MLAVVAGVLVVVPSPLWQGTSPAAPVAQHATHHSVRLDSGQLDHGPHGHGLAALRQRLTEVGRQRMAGPMPHDHSARPEPIRSHSLATWPKRAPKPAEGAQDAD